MALSPARDATPWGGLLTPQFTCFTSTKVQILTREELLSARALTRRLAEALLTPPPACSVP
jgi:hypothetical protein